jgi:hypothetical protein
MPPTNQRTPREFVFRSVTEETHRRRIRTAFVAIADCLTGGRPAPRWPWDDCARPTTECRGAVFVSQDVHYIRLALKQAQKEGPLVLDQAKHLVADYFAEKQSACFAGYERFELDASAFVGESTVDAVKEGAEAITALVACRERPSEGAWVRARRELSEAIGAFRRMVNAGHAVHEGGRRPAA